MRAKLNWNLNDKVWLQFAQRLNKAEADVTSILETRSERTSNEANVRQMKLPNVRQTKLANVHQILYFKGYLNDKV